MSFTPKTSMDILFKKMGLSAAFVGVLSALDYCLFKSKLLIILRMFDFVTLMISLGADVMHF